MAYALIPALTAYCQQASGHKKPSPAGSTGRGEPNLKVLGTPESGTLSFMWQQLGDAEGRIVVANNGDNAQDVTLNTTDLVLLPPSPDQPTDISVSLTLPTNSGQIPAHSVSSFKLSVVSRGANFTQHALYAGTIEIHDAGAKKQLLLSQPIQISVPAPQSLVSSVKFIAHRALPELACDTQTGEIPLASNTASGSPSHVVGYLQGNHHIVTVRWTETKPAAADGSKSAIAVLQFDQLPHGGSYSGDIYLSDEHGADKKVNITVDSKDYIFWPLLVVAIGVGAAWLAKRYVGVLRITWGLRKIEAELGPKFDTSQQKFAATAGNAPYATFSIAKDLAAQRETIRINLNTLEGGFKWSIVGDQTYKDTVKLIQQVQAWIAQWPTVATTAAAFKKALDAASATIDPAHMVPPNGNKGIPRVIKNGEQLISGEPLVCSAIPQLIKDLMDYTALIGTWQDANQRALLVSSEYLELVNATQAGSEESEKLEPLWSKLVAVWTELWWEVKADAFDVGENTDLSEVLQALEGLKHPAKRKVYKGDLFGLVNQNSVAAHSAKIAQVVVGSYTLSFPSDDKRRIEFLERLIKSSDWTLIIFAFIIAVLTGLNSSYLGDKPWGTAHDYIDLFLWAAGTKVGLDLITAITDKFLSPETGD